MCQYCTKRPVLFESWLHAIEGYPSQNNMGLFVYLDFIIFRQWVARRVVVLVAHIFSGIV